MKIKVLYRRNLKMSPGKLAAQACHAVIGLNILDPNISVIVLQLSDKKYFEAAKNLKDHYQHHYRVIDAGYTEIPSDTETCLAYLEE